MDSMGSVSEHILTEPDPNFATLEVIEFGSEKWSDYFDTFKNEITEWETQVLE